jgi:3-oxoacyl-[acyl-carrier-protein] synthase III
MEKRLVLLFLPLLFLMAVCSSVCQAQIYKWVDEKGTVHFSDGPSAGVVKDQDKNQDKIQDKYIDKRRDKNTDKKHFKNQDVKRMSGQDRSVDKKAAKEDTQAILKNLEFGNRQIPDDMKKYGPSGGFERPREPDQTARSSPVRRTSS